MSKAVAQRDWGEYGPAMRALTVRERLFVEHLLMGWGKQNAAEAARKAGYGHARSSALTMTQMGYKLRKREKVSLAIAEESRHLLRSGGADAVRGILNIVENPEHPRHFDALKLILDRVDPATQQIAVTTRIIDETQEALEELRALRSVGTPREKLVELYGGNGLVRLERLEQADLARRADSAKVIEAEVAEHG